MALTGWFTSPKTVQPDEIIVCVELRAVAVLASTNVLGGESKVAIDVNKFEHIAAKFAHKIGI